MLRYRLTLAFLVLMVAANAFAGSLGGSLAPQHLASWGISLNALANGQIFRLVTAVFLSHDQSMLLRQLIFAALVIGGHEIQVGWQQTLLTFSVVDIISTVLILAIVSIAWPGDISEIAFVHDVGMSAGGFGLLGSLVAGLGRRWSRLFAAGILVALAVKIMVFPDIIADGVHLISFPIGIVMRVVLDRRAKAAFPPTVSRV